MITFLEFGAEIEAARFRNEVRAFQREQKIVMRKAAQTVRKDVVAKVDALFGPSVPHKGRSGKRLGPLRKKIGYRVLSTTGDVVALIRPSASAFYGRFQETGIDTVADRKKARTVFFGDGFKRLKAGSYGFTLRRRPFLEPVAHADIGKVAEIIGGAYGVFYTGRS
jgi:hypothetical protein